MQSIRVFKHSVPFRAKIPNQISCPGSGPRKSQLLFRAQPRQERLMNMGKRPNGCQKSNTFFPKWAFANPEELHKPRGKFKSGGFTRTGGRK
ncbi:hypothetical protein TNIN_61561 [Trichonephila inaurata madagascariensis]|uniref:Uncharacterized protein n=1 Tax=Trichonephila inaurata madagascariensis TaxID=2747483 RepID=A0A8X6Y6P4_9ARAC|nr:hypothetical protein TNIN_61561 [Trichonephila inaurata madagascariensis]